MIDEEPGYLKFCLKALADDTRLRMIGVLGTGEHTVRQLASMLGVREPTVSHHISKLRSVGFVKLRMDGNQHFYRLNEESLARFKDMVAHIEEFAPKKPEASDDSWIDQLPFEDWQKKIIRDYTFAGRLRQIPSKEKKLLVILDWLSLQFDADATYSEPEVNAIIKRYHDDYATLRRLLISYGYMRRERGGAKYWVAPDNDVPES